MKRQGSTTVWRVGQLFGQEKCARQEAHAYKVERLHTCCVG